MKFSLDEIIKASNFMSTPVRATFLEALLGLPGFKPVATKTKYYAHLNYDQNGHMLIFYHPYKNSTNGLFVPEMDCEA